MKRKGARSGESGISEKYYQIEFIEDSSSFKESEFHVHCQTVGVELERFGPFNTVPCLIEKEKSEK